MTVESKFGLLRKIGQNRFDADLDRLLFVVKILAAMEVVFVDDGPPREPFWSQDEVEGLAHRRFADIVSADQKRVPR
jgi:hypothetical protein